MTQPAAPRFLRRIYVSCFLREFIFAYAIYTILFSLRGLDTLEIAALFAVWCLAAAFLEVPTGALADYWGRKTVVMIAPLVNALCFVTWFFAQGNAVLYGLGFVIWGLGGALHSGSFFGTDSRGM